MPSYNYTDPQGQSFTLDVNEELQPDQVYQRFVDAGVAQAQTPQATTDAGYLSQLGSALSIGGRQMASGVKGTFNAITGDVEDTAQAMAQMGALQQEQQANQSAEDIALNRAFAQNKEEYDRARGILPTIGALGGYVGSIASQPGAAFKQAIQSAPNAIIGAGTGLAGYALGGLVGAGAGIETGPGAVLTGIAGAAAGGAISNSLMEAGPAIYDILNERTNGAASSMTADQITQVLQQNPDIMSEGLKTGAIRGSVIGAIEGLGMKGAGRLMSIPERAAARAAQKTLIGAGVDVASKEAVESALLDPALKNAVSLAAKTAKDGFSTAGNMARLAGASGIEIGASGAGEVGAQLATGQEIDPTAAVQEMMGEVGLSIPVAVVAKGLELARTPSQIIPKELVVKANETSPDVSSSTTAFVELNENLLKTQAEGAADKAAQMLAQEQAAQAQAAAERQAQLQAPTPEQPLAQEPQAPVGLPVPTVAPTVETPSPATEQIEKSSQILIGPDVQTSTEMPVPPPTAEAGAGVGEAPVSRPTSGRRPALAPQAQEMLAQAAAINAGTQTVAPSTNEFVQKMTGQTPAKPSEDKIKRLTDDLAFSGVGEIDGVRYAIQASPDGTFYVQKTTNGVREALALGQPDISTANQVAIQIASNEYQDVSESSKAKEPAAKSQASESVGSDKEAKAGYGGMSVEEAKAYLNRPGQILGFDEPSFLDSQRQKGKIKPAPPITPTKETPTPATEGTVMPGGSAMERDLTKPEQMTPGEVFDSFNKSPSPSELARLALETKGDVGRVHPDASGSAIRLAKDALKEIENIPSKDVKLFVNGASDTAVFSKMIYRARHRVGQKGGKAALVRALSRISDTDPLDLMERIASNRELTEIINPINIALAAKKPVSAAAVDAYGIPLPSGYVKQGDLYVFQPEPSPQTTTVATPTETAAPLAKEAAVASVVQQPAEGSIPAVEQESAITAIESNEKADIADAAMAFLEEDLTESKRQWSPEKIAAAKAYFASGGKDTDVLRAAFPKLVGSRPIVQAYLKADKDASEAQAKRDAADAKLAKEIERDEKEQAKAEEAQRKREELNIKTLNSLIQKTRTNVVQGTVKPTDANQAVAILNRSGEIPNVLFTWIGTSKDFLADPANRVRYPETWAAVSANSKIEGMSENGQPIVFTDNVGVSDLDRKLANLQGTTPEVAAVRRVILHENIHKGMFFLSMKEKMQIFAFLRRMYSPEELDSLAKSYSEYADWRTNQISYFSILEEAMTRDFDSMVEIPRDGIWAEFIQFLRGIWQKITGKTSEPTLKDYKDVFRLIRNSLKNSEKANADMLVNGGGVRMSMSEFLSNVTPEQDAAYAKAVSDGDMETAQTLVDEAAEKAGLPILNENEVTAYKVRRKPAPKKTEKAYKLFRVKKGSQGEVFALFVGANDPLPQGIWLDATEGPRAEDSKTGKAKVKSKLGPLAYRPGWHAGDVPLATHIGASDIKGGPIVGRKFDEVWAEVDMASDVDYQPEANANGVTKDGSISVALADIKKMPEDGLYRYKTNPNMTGQWIISGSMKINRILSENEVNSILEKASLQTMPWMEKPQGSKTWSKTPLNLEQFGLGTNPAANQKKLLDTVTYDDQGNVIPLSRRFQAASNDIRFSKVEYESPNDAAFNSGAEVARNTDYDERDKEVRSTIRAAYDIAPKTNGPSVPLDELFSIVKQSMPDLTETEFSRILQGLYEDSGALLIEGESPFATFTTEGERAGSAIIMPPTDMTKDDVISMLRGMSAANPAPSGEINQELYDTVLTQLRNFISNGGRVPLPIQSYGATKAGRYNYTRQKDGLERDLRQGSGIGRPGQIDTGAPFRDKVERENLEIQRIDSEVSRNRETTTEGRENRKREAGARPNVGMASGGYTFADYAQIASRIGARVQEVSNDIGGGLAVMADENGATTILINAAQLSERMAGISFGLDINGALETIGNALVEELIHAADFAVQREAWLASGRRKPFTEFATNSDKSMLEDMRKVVASSNDPVKATRILFDAIQASRQLYGAGATPSDIDEIFSSPNGNISIVMSEFVRQMIQQDMHQTVSEASLFRRFIERVMKMLQKIRDAIAPAKAGEFGDILKNRINETEMMLAMAYQQTGARASMIDSDSPATNEYKQNIDAANTGKAKAPFGGVQFTNFMPIDRAVKSAEEYSEAAIKYVNNLENEGVSLDNIANSVISPAFLESIGIEQDLMAQDALTIEVRQRVDNAARKAKSPDRKKQLSKLSERLSAFWQGVGSKKGQHLGQRRYLVNKARYSWMFIRDLAERAMKDARTNILISNFGSENATSFTQNSYADSDKANQQAVDENIKNTEASQEDIDLASGEAVLDGEQKTLWERTKDWIRELGIAMRHLASLDGGTKKSVTDGQRNAIAKMSRDEVIAFIEDRKKKISEALKKILGDEAETNSPVDKIVKIAKKRAEKGLTLESLDSDSAIAKMLREINQARRGAEVPRKNPIPWRQLLSQSAKTVEEYRQRIFDAISANEELKNATPEQKARLADLFAEAWESNRTRILDGMLERMIRAEEAKKNLSKEGAKALQAQRMRIVEDINLGIFDNDELAKRMAEKFGIKSEFTEMEREKINYLIEVLQDEGLNAVKRQVAAYKLLEVLQGELKIPVVKMLADFWVSSVLSGPNTIVSIGLAVASGAFELSTALSRVFIAGFTNPKQLPSELAGAYKTLARLLSAYGRQARIAWQYLVSGDPVFLDPSMNDVTENMQWGNIGKSNKLAEQMAKSDKVLVKSAGLFMRTVSRLLTALDVFNSGLTKEGSLSIVFRQIGLDPAKIAEMEKKSDLKPYKDAIIQKDFGGTPPKSARDKAILDSYALADMMAELDKLGNVSENANFFGQQGAMTLDPSGLGGVGYRAIRSLVTNAEAGADRFLKQAQRGWNDSAQNGDRILSGLELAFAYFMQFAAYNAANFGGVRFARFAGNKFNQGLSFIPGIGFARAFEAEFDPNRISGKEAFIDSIRRNQLIGVMLSVAGYQILKAIADEPDDEKRGWFINGGWGNLTPEKKQQKLAAGEKEYTIGINNKVYNYANWPISSALAAIGSLSDLIRFSPDQWNDKNVAQIMASAAMSGAAAAADIPALSQFQELFGNSLSSKDPNEKRMERFAKVMSSYAGGFVPRFLKDIDYAQDPNLRKYETLWEKTASHIPIYRRYEGKEYYDILGQQIQRNVYPGSREFMVKPTDPAYKVLGALNSRGIWLTPANAEHRMVGKGARRRSLTQEEADNYSLETGKGYKQMLLRYGQRALQMPTERARAFLLDKADEVRDRALKKVYRGYKPAT